MTFGVIIGLIATGLSALVRNRFQKTLNELSQVPMSNGLTGQEFSQRMLNDYGVNDVKIISTPGMLTDHYNPGNKTVNLSEAVYSQRSVTAAAVAAHECGHAIQHATSYSFLKLRSAIVPVVSLSNKFSPIALMGGIAIIEIFPHLFIVGLALLAASTIFSLITLPVEFDASRRAIEWLDKSDLAQGEELVLARKGLKWAAMTYVVAAVTSLATLLYYLQMFMSRRRR